MLIRSEINGLVVSAPVLGPEGVEFLILTVIKNKKICPVAPRFTALIADPDTVDAIYVAWEAVRVRVGSVLNGLSIDIDDTIYQVLSKKKWKLEGDSIALAVFLKLHILFNNQFANYHNIVATGAIRKKKDGYTIDCVEGVREKLGKICLIKNSRKKTAIFLPKENAPELDIVNCVNDIWTVDNSLAFHCHHTAN